MILAAQDALIEGEGKITYDNLKAALDKGIDEEYTLSENSEIGFNVVIGEDSYYVSVLGEVTEAKVVGTLDDWEFDATSGKITGYKGSDSNIVIPNYIIVEGREIPVTTVTGPNPGLFNIINYSTVSSVSISKGITAIGSFAFTGYNITSVKIPDTIIDIGSRAFCNTKLSSIIIPSSVTSIGSNAFDGCSSLSEIIVYGNNFNADSNWSGMGIDQAK